jgi:hypothetical protein
MDISEIIRVKTPNARLPQFKLKLSNLIFHISSTHLTNFQSSKFSASGTKPTLLGRPKLIVFPDVICSQAYPTNGMDRGCKN